MSLPSAVQSPLKQGAWSKCRNANGPALPETVPVARTLAVLRAISLNSWSGPVCLFFLFLACAALTWRKWPDLLIDFGSQLYIPWRLANGAVLYRDIHYLTGGPLSQYSLALLFKLFGASLSTVIFSNLTILAGLLCVTYTTFRRCSDAWTATAICAGVLLVFSFNQLSDVGNYNYLTPYCHEIWHGLAISVLAVCLMARSLQDRSRITDAGVGLCVGAVFLTKPDVFIALLVVAALAAFFKWRVDGRHAWRSIFLWVAAAFVLPVIFLVYFLSHCGWLEAMKNVGGAWTPLLVANLSSEPFYRWCLGLDTPGYHLWRMAIQSGVVAGVLGLLAALFRLRLETPLSRIAAVSAVGVLAALASDIEWVDAGRVLPVLTFFALMLLLWNLAPGRGGASREPVAKSVTSTVSAGMVFPALWSVFALVLLTKLGLYSRIWHYGFALAMPAFISAVYFCHWLLPQFLVRYGVRFVPFRGAVFALLLVGFLRLFTQSQQTFCARTFPVGEDGNRFYAPVESRPAAAMASRTAPSAAVQEAVNWLRRNTSPNSTLAVLPEGVMINFLAQRKNPAHYIVWNPAELRVFGQAAMTADLKTAAPDYVMLVHREGAEYGVKCFGQEERFGGQAMQWLNEHYEPVQLIGNEPLRTTAFGIKILKRKLMITDLSFNRIAAANSHFPAGTFS